VFLPLTFKQQGRYLNFAAWFMTNMSVIWAEKGKILK
jgi:hypothetical protein